MILNLKTETNYKQIKTEEASDTNLLNCSVLDPVTEEPIGSGKLMVPITTVVVVEGQLAFLRLQFPADADDWLKAEMRQWSETANKETPEGEPTIDTDQNKPELFLAMKAWALVNNYPVGE